MGLLDDISDLLREAQSVGHELTEMKNEFVSSVQSIADDATQTVTETSAEVQAVVAPIQSDQAETKSSGE